MIYIPTTRTESSPTPKESGIIENYNRYESNRMSKTNILNNERSRIL